MQSSSNNNTTVAEYLLERLNQLGVQHLFGVPGDFVIPFLDVMMQNRVTKRFLPFPLCSPFLTPVPLVLLASCYSCSSVLPVLPVLPSQDKVRYIGTSNELNAAYAADGYARIKGIGALATTYVVGELSAINGVAGSFAEKVPVISITGTPPRKAFEGKQLLHHTIGDYRSPYKMFKKITGARTLLLDPERAPDEIDRVLRTCVLKQLPVYIGIPR
jgi:TPP-dependent 2-oxoacid decarboxylase